MNLTVGCKVAWAELVYLPYRAGETSAFIREAHYNGVMRAAIANMKKVAQGFAPV